MGLPIISPRHVDWGGRANQFTMRRESRYLFTQREACVTRVTHYDRAWVLS